MSFYSFARRWVNKKLPENVIPFTLQTFLSSFTFQVSGLYFVILGSIDFKFKSFPPIFLGIVIIALGIGYGFRKMAKKAIFKWNIEKEYKKLSKDERKRKNTFAFLFFWGSFALFFYLTVRFAEGYLVN
ncbi:hypothetical protein JM658_10870 [Joostella atrarenae]|uniref:DUF3899 domain-containing protein n=1 Tax=Joostella atrarenae TaxID=679257 RepID=A0ABS9J4H7_9FLAO|nr:hypothetical protein [Joostella atrarenae]MCF8715330.1 hypothetical protein [Joostella atrarenae]